MRDKDLEFLNTSEDGLRLQRVLREWGMVRDDLPWVPSSVTYAQLRRNVARLRSGKMRGDAGISPNELADWLEASMNQDRLMRDLTMAARGQTEIERERKEAERARRAVAGFHRLKKAAKAADPESLAAEKVRRIHRIRKKALGRRGNKDGDPQMAQTRERLICVSSAPSADSLSCPVSRLLLLS